MNKKTLEKLHNKAIKAQVSTKYFKRLKQFKSSNFVFDLESQNATSYNWWNLLSMQDGKLVFNTYVYSISTSKHINKLHHIVGALGLKPVYVDSSSNVKGIDWQEKYVRDLIKKMLSLELFLNRKKNKEYYSRVIKGYKQSIEEMQKNFGTKISKKEIEQIKKDLIASDNARREKNRLERIERKKKIDVLKPQIKNFNAIDLHDSDKANDLSEIVF